MPPKLTIDAVRERIEKSGCKLLSTSYSTNKKPLEIQCNCEAKTVMTMTLATFDRGIRCSVCHEERLKATNRERHGYDYASQRPDKKASACAGMLKHVLEKKHTIEELKEYDTTKVATAIERLYEILSSDLNRLSNAANVATNVIGGIASVTQLTVSGISSLGGDVYINGNLFISEINGGTY